MDKIFLASKAKYPVQVMFKYGHSLAGYFCVVDNWIEKNIKEVINKLNTEIFICDFLNNTEINYLYFKENIENKLCNYLKTKGVNIGGNEYNGKCKQLYL